jgi:hypothetical protein
MKDEPPPPPLPNRLQIWENLIKLQGSLKSGLVQVRCYWGDDEQRWMMWYDGHSAKALQETSPPSCIGAPPPLPKNGII